MTHDIELTDRHDDVLKPRGVGDVTGDAFIGLCCIVFGLCLICGLGVLLSFAVPKDIYQAIGIYVSASLYSCVAELFLLLGFKMFSPNSKAMHRLMNRSLVAILCLLILTAVVIVGAIVIIVW